MHRLPDGSMFELDTSPTARKLQMFFPCVPAPKGSSRTIQKPIGPECPRCHIKPTRLQYIPGSADSTQAKQRNQEKAIRCGIRQFYIANPTWMPFDGPVSVGTLFVFDAPASRKSEKYHTTYPDRDKVERQFHDCICPPKVKKVPDLSVPHLIVNDSFICNGTSSKAWFHCVEDKVPEPGILVLIKELV